MRLQKLTRQPEFIRHTACFLLAITVLCVSVDALSAHDLKSVATPNSIKIMQGNRPVLEYDRTPGKYKPYVKKLFTPGQLQILRDSPADHIHHHGLMFAISVDEVDFWAEFPEKKPGREVTDPNSLQISNQSHHISFQQKIDWQSSEGQSLVKEKRTITVYQDDDFQCSLLTWNSKLTPAQAKKSVKLSGGHYFGLGIRFVKSMDQVGTFINPTGKPGETYRGSEKLVRANWCAYSAPVDGKMVTVAMFDHPDNPRHPATWFTMPSSFAYLSATLNLKKKPMVLSESQELDLTYAVAAWDGKVAAQEIQKTYENWLSRTSK